MKRQFLGYSKAAQNFLDNKLDAFWLLVGYPNRSVIEANSRAKIALIDVGNDAKASGFYKAMPFYQPTVIPAGTLTRMSRTARASRTPPSSPSTRSLPAGSGLLADEHPLVARGHEGNDHQEEDLQVHEHEKQLQRRIREDASRRHPSSGRKKASRFRTASSRQRLT